MSDARDTETKILQFLERFKAVPGAYDKLRGHLEYMMAEKLRQDAFSSFGTLPLATLVEHVETLNGIARKTAQEAAGTVSSTGFKYAIGSTTEHAGHTSFGKPAPLAFPDGTTTTLPNIGRHFFIDTDAVPAVSFGERLEASRSDPDAFTIKPTPTGGESAVPQPQKPKRHIKGGGRNRSNPVKVAK